MIAGAAARRGRALRSCPALVLALAMPTILLCAWAGLARAQLPQLDPLPFWTPADTLAHRALHLQTSRYGDGRSGWTADRVLLDARLPVGARASFFVRLPWVRFDAGDLPAVSRWPSLAGADAGVGWPGESVLTGFGQLELGATGPLSLPLLGAASGSVAVGVPLGHSRFYPWSSAGIPARLGLSRWLGIGPRWWLSAGAALVAHGGPGGEELAPDAFPDGWETRLGIERKGRPVDLRLGWERHARSGRREEWLEGEAWAPWSGGSRVGLRVAREITGSPDRAAAWAVGLLWRLAPRAAEVTGARAKPAATDTPAKPAAAAAR